MDDDATEVDDHEPMPVLTTTTESKGQDSSDEGGGSDSLAMLAEAYAGSSQAEGQMDDSATEDIGEAQPTATEAATVEAQGGGVDGVALQQPIYIDLNEADALGTCAGKRKACTVDGHADASMEVVGTARKPRVHAKEKPRVPRRGYCN